MLEDAVDNRAQDVELHLVVGRVSDPHGPTAGVSAQMVELAFDRRIRVVDGIENLQVVSQPLGRHDATLWLEHVAQEREKVVGLGVKPERVELTKGEGGVANPGVSIVPVATAPEALGQ